MRRWFAWHPVKVGDEWIWWKSVSRKKNYWYAGPGIHGGIQSYWVYAKI